MWKIIFEHSLIIWAIIKYETRIAWNQIILKLPFNNSISIPFRVLQHQLANSMPLMFPELTSVFTNLRIVNREQLGFFIFLWWCLLTIFLKIEWSSLLQMVPLYQRSVFWWSRRRIECRWTFQIRKWCSCRFSDCWLLSNAFGFYLLGQLSLVIFKVIFKIRSVLPNGNVIITFICHQRF